MKNDDPKTFNFEKALEELNTIVQRMENSELSIEQSLKDFEHGIKLTGECQKALTDAEQTVKILLEKSANSELSPFEPKQDDD